MENERLTDEALALMAGGSKPGTVGLDYDEALTALARELLAHRRATPADDLRAENERLRQALGFYADPRNWIDSPEWDGPGTSTPKAVPVMNEPFGSRPCDCGDTARAALSQPAPTASMAADNAIGNLRSHGYEIDALLRQRDRGEL